MIAPRCARRPAGSRGEVRNTVWHHGAVEIAKLVSIYRQLSRLSPQTRSRVPCLLSWLNHWTFNIPLQKLLSFIDCCLSADQSSAHQCSNLLDQRHPQVRARLNGTYIDLNLLQLPTKSTLCVSIICPQSFSQTRHLLIARPILSPKNAVARNIVAHFNTYCYEINVGSDPGSMSRHPKSSHIPLSPDPTCQLFSETNNPI